MGAASSVEPPVWSRRDGLWTLGSCAPAGLYALVLKSLRLSAAGSGKGALRAVTLIGSDLLTVLAWVALCMFALSCAREPRGRKLVTMLLKLALTLYAAVLLGAHGYFRSTGESLDFSTLAFAISRLSDSSRVIASASTWLRWAGFGLTTAGIWCLPWLLTRRCEQTTAPSASASTFTLYTARVGSFGLSALAFTGALNVRYEGSTELTRDPFLHVLTTLGEAHDHESDPAILAAAAHHPHGPDALQRRAGARPKNLVIVMLESTSAWATSVYGGHYDTTPFMRELARRALVAERAYSVIPHTSKAMVSTLCGIEPRPGVEMVEAFEHAIPGRCLASLLDEQGYRTALFMSATKEFENSPALVRNMGFHEFLSGDRLDHTGLSKANYFGYEDRILIEPTRTWLAQHAHESPFFLAFLTNTPHHDYLAPPRYGRVHYVDDDEKNRYLNTVRYQDFFLRELFEVFEQQGALEDTVFVLVGDHGDAFGEHKRYVHDDIMYDECVRIPLLVLDGKSVIGKRVQGPFTQLDVAPTALELMGFDTPQSAYSGRSLTSKPAQRTLFLSCLTDNKCVARLEGARKFIHNFGRRPDELYDLEKDGGERNNLAHRSGVEAARAREQALRWYRTMRAVYQPAFERAASDLIRNELPQGITHRRTIRFGNAVEYLGWSVDHEPIKPGDWVTVTYYFHVLEQVPPGFKLHLEIKDGDGVVDWSHTPLQRLYPESRWRKGQYLIDSWREKVGKRFPDARVIVRGGFRRKGGDRLEASPADAQQTPALVEIPIAGR